VKAYYEDDHVTIYHGDSREVLPSIAADVVVTDPPYGTKKYATDQWVLDGAMLRELRTLGPVAVFGWPEKLCRLVIDYGTPPDAWQAWWPTNGACRGQARIGAVRETEHIALFGEWHLDANRVERSASAKRAMAGAHAQNPAKDRADVDTRRTPDVWRDPAPGVGFQYRNRLHPNEKPVSIMEKLLVGAVPGVVFDPFMGSGTTLAAAKVTGRHAIGVEMVEEHCETAARRLAGMLDLGGAA
jgi:site-specific DNA-methyltransferase (adenine-specific)